MDLETKRWSKVKLRCSGLPTLSSSASDASAVTRRASRRCASVSGRQSPSRSNDRPLKRDRADETKIHIPGVRLVAAPNAPKRCRPSEVEAGSGFDPAMRTLEIDAALLHSEFPTLTMACLEQLLLDAIPQEEHAPSIPDLAVARREARKEVDAQRFCRMHSLRSRPNSLLEVSCSRAETPKRACTPRVDRESENISPQSTTSVATLRDHTKLPRMVTTLMNAQPAKHSTSVGPSHPVIRSISATRVMRAATVHG
jgi:hypothetical protein